MKSLMRRPSRSLENKDTIYKETMTITMMRMTSRMTVKRASSMMLSTVRMMMKTIKRKSLLKDRRNDDKFHTVYKQLVY